MKEYYSQRASDPSTFLITEATLIAQKAGVFKNIPGVYAWKEITDTVHAKGSFIFCKLWGQGRWSRLARSKREKFVAPSAIKLSYTSETLRPFTLDEIHEYPKLFAQAAANTIFKAGFEVNAVNGFLIDQFIQDASNQCTHGGSIENRARFPPEVIDAVVDAVGAHRTAFRVSPWSTFQEMGMEDPITTFSYLATKIGHTDLAYLHVIELRVNGTEEREDEPGPGESNDFSRELWAPRPLILAGGYTREDAMKVADERGVFFLIFRRNEKKNLSSTPYNRSAFYLPGEVTEGYTDYPFASEE
ncbi:FMN-linked oxidoreductase [Armillaria gallica]|uniref:FMN-linked oxidoreductase n=1 Tax=Armillaria gallica TaxID=47427 RepID=A0A2H3DCT9_ARMGA|nr:FMN-linked oxidoreductase [Armillaria gallica]